jgi:hypothetical protein
LHVFDSQKIHIKRSPNAMKIYGELFWNICDFWELESAQKEAHAAHHPPAHQRRAWRAVVGGGLLKGRLEPFFWRKKDNIRKKIMLKFQCNQSYGSMGI